MGRPRKFSRDGVLQKALPVFWKYGFTRTTLPDLERATGVNKSGLYSEFESKEELFLACLRYYLDTPEGGGIPVHRAAWLGQHTKVPRGSAELRSRSEGMLLRELDA